MLPMSIIEMEKTATSSRLKTESEDEITQYGDMAATSKKIKSVTKWGVKTFQGKTALILNSVFILSNSLTI